MGFAAGGYFDHLKLDPISYVQRHGLDHAEHGGALLLGVNGICVIGHGSSKALSVVSALRLAHSAASHGVMDDLAGLQEPSALSV